VVRIFAEYGGQWLWAKGGGIDPRELGISEDLIRRFDEWNDEWEASAPWDDPKSLADAEVVKEREDGQRWQRTGIALAFELQREFTALGKDIDVFYVDDDDPRPMSAR
jgi:hypothetical protein